MSDRIDADDQPTRVEELADSGDLEIRAASEDEAVPGQSVFDAAFIDVDPADRLTESDRPAAIPPPPPVAAKPRRPAVAASTGPAGMVRDRIVVLGRRKAGKTIFLARLYEQLWRSTDTVHMRAIDGNDHLFFMETIRVLSERVWPPATGSSTRIPLEVTLDGKPRTLVSLDYSGEVFKRAFLEQVSDPDTEELLDHLDRAAAVILLVDPGLVLHGTPEQIAEDEFGMTAAVRRIRQGPGGSHIPIALVLTKLDAHGRVVRECGGLVGFVKTHLFPLLRALHRVRVFGCVAVRTRPDAMGQPRPDPSTPALGLLEPLEHCLRAMPEIPVAMPAPRAARSPEPSEAETEEDSVPPWKFIALMAILVAVGAAAGVLIAWAVGLAGAA
ncbi:MAG: TRAFAC clade GTPase domain-containing protein [Phycisphaerales bacterium]